MTATLFDPSPGEVAHLEWREELDDKLVCVAVHDVTHDVRSFVLRPAEPAAYRFQPGQHLTLTVDMDGQAVSRCYTIASSPAQPDELTITVKRVPDGLASNWLHDHLRPGDPVVVDGPLGSFSTAHHPAERYLFLSAGSGITPLMSMLRTIHGARDPVDVVFVHHARTPADIIFRDELRVIEAEHPGVWVVVVCEDDAEHERWTGPRGRVTLPMLLGVAPDLIDREVFTCGPAPYMEAVRGLLAQAGADPDRCHEESFDLVPRCRAGRHVHRLDVHGRAATERVHRRVRRGHHAAGRRRTIRPQLALVVPGGDVRHLQDHLAVRPGRDEPRRGHPAPRDRAGQDPALLLDTVRGPGP